MKETNNCGFCIAALVVVFTAGAVSGSEWNTASGKNESTLQGVNSIDIHFGPKIGPKIGPRCKIENTV